MWTSAAKHDKASGVALRANKAVRSESNRSWKASPRASPCPARVCPASNNATAQADRRANVIFITARIYDAK
jgi:hypothetical protein